MFYLQCHKVTKKSNLICVVQRKYFVILNSISFILQNYFLVTWCNQTKLVFIIHYLRISSTGQWSLPNISLSIDALCILSRRRFETTK